jgi:predicted GIY-YIG superfamily endonuclease
MVVPAKAGTKLWNRAWKIRLLEKMNPEWKDLSERAF